MRMTASINSSKAHWDRGTSRESLKAWLLWNMPPLDGRLRFVFYSGSLALFFLLNGGTGFTIGSASPYLYEPRGLTAWLGIPYLSPAAMRVLMTVTYLAWACAAVGLLTRPAKVATAALMFLAVGFEQAYEPGSNHTHYLLLYSLVCLSFSSSDHDWSVDAWLQSRRPGRPRPLQNPGGLGSTGLPRQAVLLLAVTVYFSSGLSKLTDAGLIWSNGYSLQYYIASQVDRTSFEVITGLRTWVSEQRWLCQALSVLTMLIELGAPLALISRRLRHVMIPAWVGMHMGIVLLMTPNYWIHSWCVAVLLTDWQWVGQLWTERGRPQRTSPELRELDRVTVSGVRIGIVGSALAALAVVPPVLQIEWYPITHVPMYSSYVAPGAVAGIPIEDFGVEERVYEIASACAGSRVMGYTRRCSWILPRQLGDRVTLSLSGPDRGPDEFPGSTDDLRNPLIAHLAARRTDASLDSATQLMDRVRAVLYAQPPGALAGYDRFALEYRLNQGSIPLVSGSIGPSD